MRNGRETSELLTQSQRPSSGRKTDLLCLWIFAKQFKRKYFWCSSLPAPSWSPWPEETLPSHCCCASISSDLLENEIPDKCEMCVCVPPAAALTVWECVCVGCVHTCWLSAPSLWLLSAFFFSFWNFSYYFECRDSVCVGWCSSCRCVCFNGLCLRRQISCVQCFFVFCFLLYFVFIYLFLFVLKIENQSNEIAQEEEVNGADAH